MPHTQAPARTDWSLVLLVLGAGIVAGCQVGKVPPSLPSLRADLHLSLFAAGWVISLIGLLAACGGAVAGAAADWLGHRRVVLLGLSVTAVASVLGSLAQTPGWLLFTRVFEGIGYIAISVAGPVLILQVTRPRDERLALSVWAGYMPAGTSLMMLLSPLFLQSIGWRGLWVVNGFLVAGVALLLAWKSPHPSRNTGGMPTRFFPELKATFSRPGPIVLALYFGAFALQFMAVVGFLPTLLIEEVGLGKGVAAALAGVAVLLNVPGNLVGGWLLHRGVRRTLSLGFASLVMGLCALGIYSPFLPGALRYVLCLVFTGVGGVIPASLYAAAPLHAPSRSALGTTNGIMMQGGNLGSMLGPPAMAAVVAGVGGWHAAPWLLVSAAGVSLALAVWLDRIEAAAAAFRGAGTAAQ
ncbi:MAG TPA: MFS transporter [Deferrisomatales bacterium]|nr:MFS transporter [Deferrisomatales bacterium]